MKINIRVVCLLAAIAVALLAQIATLRGVVRDPAGAIVSGATIIAKSVNTGQTVQGQSDTKGTYQLLLPPGQYEVRIEMPGFRAETFRVDIGPGKTIDRNATLQVGGVTETVEVHADAARIRLPRFRRFGKLETPPATTEEYARIQPEGFQPVRRRPLSTFSVDVDTASYSNVRRFLLDGRRPPPDAVRIEEMLNYFRYAYPDPTGPHPFSVRVEMAECPWNPAHALAQIGLKTKPIETADLPPANLVFLIDVSGSMLPDNKLPLLTRSLALLVGELRAKDRVAIVVYAGAAGLVLPSTSGSEKDRILDAIENLTAGGSTAGGAGIQLAYREAREHLLTHGNNRVILATDGDFNVGASSDDDMVRLIEAEREHGIALTVLGFGYGNLKDSKLEKLADHGNGNYAYIDSLDEARKVLVQGLGATLLTVAKDVKLQVEFNPAYVQEWRLIGYDNRRLHDEDFRDDKKDAGDMGAGHMVTALYELVPPGAKSQASGAIPLKYQPDGPRANQAALPGEAMTVKLRYKQPRESRSREFAVAVPFARTPIGSSSADMRFASAVAEFGMALRGASRYDAAIERLAGAMGEDPDGRKAELLYLMKTARLLKN
jgi:Ca-activated chloride channel family protein